MWCCISGVVKTNTRAWEEFKQRCPVHTRSNKHYQRIWYIKKSIDCEPAQLCVKKLCLSDSVVNVFFNPKCLCTNKKLFDWENGREKVQRRWAQLPRSYACIVSDLCLQACRCLWCTILSSNIISDSFSHTIWNSQSPLLFPRCGWHEVYSLIFSGW